MQWAVLILFAFLGSQSVFAQESEFKLEPRPWLAPSYSNTPEIDESAPQAAFNDPYFEKQKFLAMIEAEAAYKILAENGVLPRPRIGIIDQGRVSGEHVELQGRLLAGSDTEKGSVEHGHFVLGIMAAKSNNSSGIVGIAGGPADFYYRSLPLVKRKPDPVQLAALIREMGPLRLDAINLSFAVERKCSSSPRSGEKECYHAIVAHSGIRQAMLEVSRLYNTLFFVSAGNSSQKIPQYSLPSQGILVVGSTTKDKKIASHSNHGPGVDVYLPEVGIYGLTAKGVGSPQVGTSFTTPVATAAAALTYRYLKNSGVNLTPGQFMALVLNSSQSEPELLRDTSSGRMFNFRKLAEEAQKLRPTGR